MSMKLVSRWTTNRHPNRRSSTAYPYNFPVQKTTFQYVKPSRPLYLHPDGRALVTGELVRLVGNCSDTVRTAIAATDMEAMVALYRLKFFLANSQLLTVIAASCEAPETLPTLFSRELKQVQAAVSSLLQERRLLTFPGNLGFCYKGEMQTPPISLVTLDGKMLSAPQTVIVYRCYMSDSTEREREVLAVLAIPWDRIIVGDTVQASDHVPLEAALVAANDPESAEQMPSGVQGVVRDRKGRHVLVEIESDEIAFPRRWLWLSDGALEIVR